MLLRAHSHMKNHSQKRLSNGPWLVPNGWPQASKSCWLQIAYCELLWGTVDATLSGEVTGKRALCWRVLLWLCHLFNLGYICERGGLSDEAEIVLGWCGCFHLTWTIVSLLWSIESPGPNLWVLFFMLLAHWFVLVIYGLPPYFYFTL